MSILKKLTTAAITTVLSFGAAIPVLANEELYTDVLISNPDYTGIKYCKENAIMTGVGEDKATFEPESIVNRAQMAVILYRLEGSPEVKQKAIPTCQQTNISKWNPAGPNRMS